MAGDLSEQLGEAVVLIRGDHSDLLKEMRELRAQFEKDVDDTGSKTSMAFAGWMTHLAEHGVEAFKEIGEAAKEFAVELVEMTEKGSKLADIRDRFTELTQAIGVDSVQAITALRSGTQGLVSDYDLLVQSNKLLGSGMHLTTDQMDLLGKTARVLANSTGIETKDAFEQVSQALLTGRTRALAATGVFVELKGAQDALKLSSEAEGESMDTASTLTARRGAVLAAFTKLTKDAGDQEVDLVEKVKQGNTAWENFKDEIGEAISRSPALNTAFTTIGKSLEDAFGGQKESLIHNLVIVIEQLALITVEGAALAVDAFRNLGDGILKIMPLMIQYVGLASMATLVWGQMSGNKMEESVGKTGVDMVISMAVLIGKTKEFDSSMLDVAKALRTGAEAMKATMGESENLNAHLKAGKGAANDNADGVNAAAKAIDEFKKKSKELSELLQEAYKVATNDNIVAAYGNQIKELAKQAAALGQEMDYYQRDALQLTFLAEFGKKIAAEAKKIEDEKDKIHQEGWDRFVAGTKTNDKMILETMADRQAVEAKLTQNQYQQELLSIQQTTTAKQNALDKNGANYQEAMEEIRKWTAEKMEQAATEHNNRVNEMKASVNSWGNLFKGWLQNIPGLIQQAMTGGGGFAGAMKAIEANLGSSIGGKIGDELMGPITKGLSSAFGPGIGSAIGSMIPMIGAALGPLIGKGLEWIGTHIFGIGPSQQELIQQSRDAFLKAQGGLEEFRQKIADVSGDPLLAQAVTHLFDAQSMKDWNKALKEFQDEYTIALQKAKKAQDELQKEQEANAQRLKLETDAEQEARDRLQAAIQKYGFTVEQLGPKWRQQNMTGQAQELIADYTALTASGMDVAVVLGGMSDSINKFVQDSARAGTEVPLEMKPILQHMVDLGLLVDENGTAIGDLSNIHFAMSMNQEFDRVIDKLGELIKVITDGLGGALSSILPNIGALLNQPPPTPGHSAGGPPNPVPDGGETGQSYNQDPYAGLTPEERAYLGLPELHDGGMANWGQQGTLAVLHGPEAVIPIDQLQEMVGGHGMDPHLLVAAMREAGLSGGVTLAPVFQGMIAEEARGFLRDHWLPLTVQVLRESGTLRNQLGVVLGV